MLLVGGKDGENHLDFFADAFGEKGADGAVGKAGREDGLLARASFAAEEAAGNLTGGVEPLFVFDGERQEVDFGTGPVGHDGGGQDNGFAVAEGDGPVGLEGQLAGFQGQAFAPQGAFNNGGHCNSRHGAGIYLAFKLKQE